MPTRPRRARRKTTPSRRRRPRPLRYGARELRHRVAAGPGFEGGEGSTVEPGPSGGSGNALKVLRSGGQVFALAIVTLPSTIPLEAGRLTISARVNSPTAGIPMVLKLEGPGGNPSSGDLQANEAVVGGWQTLTWTVPAVNTNYNTLVLLPNLGTVDAPPGQAYYFDDIQLLGTASGGLRRRWR